MRSLLFSILLIVGILPVAAQIKMDITDLIISQLEKNADITENDTLIYHEGKRKSPYLEATIRFTNLYDTIIAIQPNISEMYILYKYRGKSYKKNMQFSLNEDNKLILYENKIILKPHEEIYISLWGYIVEMGTFLELEFSKLSDYKEPLIEILPTLRFKYLNSDGTVIYDDNIFNVKIKKNYYGD